MVNREKINSTRLVTSLKTIIGLFIFVLVFSTCKKTTVTNDPPVNPGPVVDSSTVPIADSISITIAPGDSLIGIRGFLLYGGPSILVTNKAGKPLSGIPLSLTPCSECGSVNWVYMIACNGCTPVPVDTTFYTNSDGIASASWRLGTLSDSIQTLVATVRNHPNVSVTVRATTRYFKLHNFIGTINIVAPGDTSGPAAPFLLPYNGVTPFQQNANMPLEMDSMSLDVNHYVIAPQMIIINGDTVMSNGQNTLNCCSFLGGIGYQSGDSNYSYQFNWYFYGTGTNHVFSGTFDNVVDYYVELPTDVLRGVTNFGGPFSVTQQ
jgi:hypothetical protein